MRRYKTEFDTKAGLDRLQMMYGCCGSRGAGDWFDVSWVGTEYVNPDRVVVAR